MFRSQLAKLVRVSAASTRRPAASQFYLTATPIARSFTAGAARRFPGSGLASSDAELVAALRAEQKIEKESLDQEEASETERFHSFAQRAGFEIIEKPGAEEVQLLKAQGSETIRIFFSISDVINSDSLLDDAELPEQPGHQERNGQTPEDEAIDDDADFESPIRLNIVVEKPAGSISIEAVAQDDLVLVESITPYESSAVACDETAEGDYKRRQTYQGPPFSVLDPSVQGAVQEFLEARKIDGNLALFIAQYSSYRENREYINWLGRIADVVGSQ